MESILAYKLRTRFFPDILFLQNHIANYGAWFKVQKLMLPSLKCQIFHFWSKFILFILLSRQQIQFSKIWLCHSLVYMVKNPIQKIEEIHWVSQIDGQTDGHTNMADFIGTLPQRWRFDHVSRKFENKILNYLTWLWAM